MYPDIFNSVIYERSSCVQTLQLEFLNFTLESSEAGCLKADYVEVYQGDNGDDEDTMVGRFCGQTPPPAITATGNALFVRWVLYCDPAVLMMIQFNTICYKVMPLN